MDEHVKDMFIGMNPEWKKIILGLKLKPLFIEVLNEINEKIDSVEDLIPKPCNIFQAFKYFSPSDLKCVIIGQDPYPDPNEAYGLSFSTPPDYKKIPKSLANIYKALLKSNCISQAPKSGNLDHWAKQGVLLLNVYLTRSSELHPFWSKFTFELVKEITLIGLNKMCIFMLWGGFAKKLTPMIKKVADNSEKIHIMEYIHPSPLAASSGNFSDCPHFIDTNKLLIKNGLSEINWNPCIMLEPISTPVQIQEPNKLSSLITKKCIVMGTDGGCSANGKAHAKASYGVYFPPKFNNAENLINTSLCSLIPAYDLKLDLSNLKLIATTNPRPPTNGRGELLAAINSLLHVFEKHKTINCQVIMIIDAEYVLHLINERIWKYAEKNTLDKQEANSDLVVILYQLLCELAKRMGLSAPYHKKLLQPNAHNYFKERKPMDLEWPYLIVLYQRAHLKKHEIPPGQISNETWYCNAQADQLSTKALAESTSQ